MSVTTVNNYYAKSCYFLVLTWYGSQTLIEMACVAAVFFPFTNEWVSGWAKKCTKVEKNIVEKWDRGEREEEGDGERRNHPPPYSLFFSLVHSFIPFACFIGNSGYTGYTVEPPLMDTSHSQTSINSWKQTLNTSNINGRSHITNIEF